MQAGISASEMARAEKRSANSSPRASVRLATTTDWGLCATKYVAASSTISPTPTSMTFVRERSPKRFCASLSAAAAIETDCAPREVSLRTCFATANVLRKSPPSIGPSVPRPSAARTDCFTWPRICGSPSTMESSPDATRKAWRMAASSECM